MTLADILIESYLALFAMYLWEKRYFEGDASISNRYEERTFAFRMATLISVLLIFFGVSFRINLLESALAIFLISIALSMIGVFRSRWHLASFLGFMLGFTVVYFECGANLITFIVSPMIFFLVLSASVVVTRKIDC